MHIRSATLADVPSMLAIAAHAATAGHWSPDTYARILDGDSSRLVLVLEDPDCASVLAFVVALCAGPEWEIENIAVAGTARRRGLGTRLMSTFLDRARAGGAEAVFLEVRESNRAARALYEKWAFVEVGRRPRYYSDPSEDAILYRFDFSDPALPSAENPI